MKSEDIIKAMMQCYAMDCDGCPFRDKNDCGKCEELIPIAIDLLKKQNEELAAYRAAEQEREKMRCYACANEGNSEDCPLDYHKQTDFCSYFEPCKEANQ